MTNGRRHIRQSHKLSCYNFNDRHYSWIGPPVETHKKLICQRTVRATTTPRPPLESSRQGESKPAETILVKVILTSFFKITFQIMSQQK